MAINLCSLGSPEHFFSVTGPTIYSPKIWHIFMSRIDWTSSLHNYPKFCLLVATLAKNNDRFLMSLLFISVTHNERRINSCTKHRLRYNLHVQFINSALNNRYFPLIFNLPVIFRQHMWEVSEIKWLSHIHSRSLGNVGHQLLFKPQE